MIYLGNFRKETEVAVFFIRNVLCNIAAIKKVDKIKKFIVNVINKKLFVSNCIAELVIIGE